MCICGHATLIFLKILQRQELSSCVALFYSLLIDCDSHELFLLQDDLRQSYFRYINRRNFVDIGEATQPLGGLVIPFRHKNLQFKVSRISLQFTGFTTNTQKKYKLCRLNCPFGDKIISLHRVNWRVICSKIRLQINAPLKS